ncbi:hypothetical protein Tco_1071331 [Tanacetum coccineum]
MALEEDYSLRSIRHEIVATSRYVVPTGRVKGPAGRYVVPTSKDNVIVSAGRTKVIPARRKESEFPELHFMFTAYNQLQSKVPYRDEDSKLIYLILTDYLGCICSINDVIPSGNANIGQKYQRKVDIGSLE